MKQISACMLLTTALALAGCASTASNTESGNTMGSSSAGSSAAGTSGGGTAPTTGGAEAANADVKGSTSATGATPANEGQRR